MYQALKVVNPETDGASAHDVVAAHSFFANVISEQLDTYYVPPIAK